MSGGLPALLRRGGRILVDVVFPPRCFGCELVGVWICDACRARLPRIQSPFCSRCGEESSRPVAACGWCDQLVPGLVEVRSAMRHEDPVRGAIHRLKYRGVRALAEPLADLAVPALSATSHGVDAILPVPLHRRRLRERGYNQAALLAARIAPAIGVPLRTDLLVRTRDTRSQVDVGTPEARRRNVDGAFECGDATGLRVLLIDDVSTTGSTLNAAAAALLTAGAVSVGAFTVARGTVANDRRP
jgi:ComF family protein